MKVSWTHAEHRTRAYLAFVQTLQNSSSSSKDSLLRKRLVLHHPLPGRETNTMNPLVETLKTNMWLSDLRPQQSAEAGHATARASVLRPYRGRSAAE